MDSYRLAEQTIVTWNIPEVLDPTKRDSKLFSGIGDCYMGCVKREASAIGRSPAVGCSKPLGMQWAPRTPKKLTKTSKKVKLCCIILFQRFGAFCMTFHHVTSMSISWVDMSGLFSIVSWLVNLEVSQVFCCFLRRNNPPATHPVRNPGEDKVRGTQRG